MDVLNFAAANGYFFIVGIIILALGVFMLAGPKKAMRSGLGAVTFGAIFILVAAIVPFAGSTGVTVAPPPPGASINTIEQSAYSLPAGETWNSVTNTLTVDLVYATHTNVWNVQASTASNQTVKNYVILPISMIRTDAINATFSFPATVASIPTVASIGSTPTVYSFVGYVPATGTAPAQWQVKWDAGTQANQFPTVSAPGTSTNVITSGIPINSFSSKSLQCHISLGGGNSTSAPLAFAQAISNYTSYPMTFSYGNSVPATMTINFIVIAWVYGA